MEALKLQIQNEIESLYGTRDKQMQDYLVQTYGDTYYHTAYEIQKGIGLESSVYSLDTNKVNQIIHKPWAVDGKNFSERIWEDKNKLINTLHNKLTQSFIRGSSPYQIVSDIAKEFDVKKSIAGRLVMTESAAYSSKAQERCYKDLGIDQYEIVATLDRNTSSICQEMDGKVFSMKEYEVGVTANPFHPNCRTVTAPYFADDTKSMRAMRNKNGKIEYVSADMKYKEWFNKYVKNDKENDIIELDKKSDNIVLVKCMANQIEYKGIERYKTIPNEEEIIANLSGGDKTKGSCSSLAFAYGGNKAGYSVLDFRDGKSRELFSNRNIINEILETKGIKGWKVNEKNDYVAIKKLIVNMEDDKEYYLAIGRHAAIIKKKEKQYKYLELQSSKENGFKPFNINVLKNRFACKKTYKIAGTTYSVDSVLIDIESFKNNDEFLQMLVFINTAENKQVKGIGGYEK